MTANSYRGVFTIPSTPFRENGEVDVPQFATHDRFLY